MAHVCQKEEGQPSTRTLLRGRQIAAYSLPDTGGLGMYLGVRDGHPAASYSRLPISMGK
jgi:hypothetical protein